MSVLLVLALAGVGAGTLHAAAPQASPQPRELQNPSAVPSVYEQPQAAQNEFVPVKDLPRQEQLPAAPLVMGAYAFVWVALVVYVWSLWRRVKAVQSELNELRRQVGARKQA
jgi:CcmD family protein